VRFSDDSFIWLAVLGIVAVFLAVWALLTARDPKRWRQWWMAMLGLTDMNTTREQRRRQEFYISIGGYVAFSLFLGVSVISGYCVFVSIQEQRRAPSDYEQAKDKTIKDFNKMRTNKQFRKL
jgi:Na+/melibiose symporter-like transporter